ncbi:hypothetical protein B0H13DRAFT_1892234 [Mycena leptocephala]|nr:hypothetical protein B0H13DRAFT_1892234 [Mycena leptocephala]
MNPLLALAALPADVRSGILWRRVAECRVERGARRGTGGTRPRRGAGRCERCGARRGCASAAGVVYRGCESPETEKRGWWARRDYASATQDATGRIDAALSRVVDANVKDLYTAV